MGNNNCMLRYNKVRVTNYALLQKVSGLNLKLTVLCSSPREIYRTSVPKSEPLEFVMSGLLATCLALSLAFLNGIDGVRTCEREVGD